MCGDVPTYLFTTKVSSTTSSDCSYTRAYLVHTSDSFKRLIVTHIALPTASYCAVTASMTAKSAIPSAPYGGRMLSCGATWSYQSNGNDVGFKSKIDTMTTIVSLSTPSAHQQPPLTSTSTSTSITGPHPKPTSYSARCPPSATPPRSCLSPSAQPGPPKPTTPKPPIRCWNSGRNKMLALYAPTPPTQPSLCPMMGVRSSAI